MKRDEHFRGTDGVCPHCDEPVIQAFMRRSGAEIRLDPTTGPRGNLMLLPGAVAEFIPADRRTDPTDPLYVPPADRYQAHQVSCAANERTTSTETRDFIADVDRRLASKY